MLPEHRGNPSLNEIRRVVSRDLQESVGRAMVMHPRTGVVMPKDQFDQEVAIRKAQPGKPSEFWTKPIDQLGVGLADFSPRQYNDEQVARDSDGDYSLDKVA